jgi:hypothetical protein
MKPLILLVDIEMVAGGGIEPPIQFQPSNLSFS